MDIDQAKLDALLGRMVGEIGATASAPLVIIGDRLGLYKAIREGAVDPAASVSVGIRTDNPDTMGVTILDAPSVHRDGVDATLARIRQAVGDRPVYITFDIDALDPAFAPGTGTPVWGGLASWQAAALLRGLAGVDLIGGDVVEVSPPYDTTGATAIAGAHVATELIALYGWTRR